MLPKVVNKFLDSTLHKVLPGLVSGPEKATTPRCWDCLGKGWQMHFMFGADPDWLIVAGKCSETVAGSVEDSATII